MDNFFHKVGEEGNEQMMNNAGLEEIVNMVDTFLAEAKHSRSEEIKKHVEIMNFMYKKIFGIK